MNKAFKRHTIITLKVEKRALLVTALLLTCETLHHHVLLRHVGVVLSKSAIENSSDFVPPLHFEEKGLPTLLISVSDRGNTMRTSLSYSLFSESLRLARLAHDSASPCRCRLVR